MASVLVRRPGSTTLRLYNKGAAEMVLERSVAAYFHSDGHLAEAVVARDVKQLLAQLEEAKSK